MTLRSGSPEQVRKMFQGLQREADAIMDNVISIIYFMRGSVSFENMMQSITPGIRQKMVDFLEKRFEAEKGKPNPIY